MTTAPIVVTHWSDDVAFPTRTIQATTNLEVHLTLTHSLLYPIKTPRLIRERGKDRICGFYLRWISYTCHEQSEPGPTTAHTFTIPGIPIATPSWCAIAESCHPIPKQFATPPIPLAPSAAPPGLSYLELGDIDPIPCPIGPQTPAFWRAINSAVNWGPIGTPVSIVTIPQEGDYLITAAASYQLSGLPTWYERTYANPPHVAVIERSWITGNPQPAVPSNPAMIHLEAGALIDLRTQNNGPGTLDFYSDPGNPAFLRIAQQ